MVISCLLDLPIRARHAIDRFFVLFFFDLPVSKSAKSIREKINEQIYYSTFNHQLQLFF